MPKNEAAFKTKLSIGNHCIRCWRACFFCFAFCRDFESDTEKSTTYSNPSLFVRVQMMLSPEMAVTADNSLVHPWIAFIFNPLKTSLKRLCFFFTKLSASHSSNLWERMYTLKVKFYAYLSGRKLYKDVTTYVASLLEALCPRIHIATSATVHRDHLKTEVEWFYQQEWSEHVCRSCQYWQ